MLAALMASTILGGPITDAFDRRKVLLVMQVLQAGSSSLLLVGALIGHPPIGLVYAGVALMAAVGGIGPLPDAPSVDPIALATLLVVPPISWLPRARPRRTTDYRAPPVR